MPTEREAVERLAEVLWAYEGDPDTDWVLVAGGHHGDRVKAKAQALLSATFGFTLPPLEPAVRGVVAVARRINEHGALAGEAGNLRAAFQVLDSAALSSPTGEHDLENGTSGSGAAPQGSDVTLTRDEALNVAILIDGGDGDWRDWDADDAALVRSVRRKCEPSLRPSSAAPPGAKPDSQEAHQEFEESMADLDVLAGGPDG